MLTWQGSDGNLYHVTGTSPRPGPDIARSLVPVAPDDPAWSPQGDPRSLTEEQTNTSTGTPTATG